jgi:hypothetical protein
MRTLLWAVGLWIGLALVLVFLLVLLSVGRGVFHKVSGRRRNGPTGAGESSAPSG